MEVYDYIGLKAYDEIHALDTAEKKGIKKGLEKGIKIGEEKGEQKAKIKIAKNGLNNGLDIETIVLLTGLNKEEIEEIKKGI
jgi:predicted transposase/invertase (TIGR01784 family)